MNSIRITFAYPWILLLLIPAIILTLLPYLKLKPHRRRTRNRVVSLILHMIILLLVTSVFAGMNIKTENSIQKNDVIILVDASESTNKSQEEIDNYIESILKGYNKNNKIGIVKFANESIYSAKFNKNGNRVFEEYINDNNQLDTSATNISEALYFSQSLLDSEKNSRIIILTDGLETDGEALLAANNLAGDGIQIDAVFFGKELANSEIQINSLEIADTPLLNTPVTITAELQSNIATSLDISIYDNDTLLETKNIFITKGIQSVSFVQTFASAGNHLLHVSLSSTNDTLIQNNLYYTFFNISLDTRILVIDGTGSESVNLVHLLENEYAITTVSASSAPTALEELNQYGEIILMNVSNSSLPNGYDVILEQYALNGGSIFTTGGENTYYYGEMENSKFNDFLPIDILRNDDEPIAIMFVIDGSSSMAQNIAGSNKSKLDLAIEGAVESLESLNSYDFVGVIAFDASAKLVLPMTPASQKDTITNAIKSIRAGYGTNYVPALRLANNTLLSFTQVNTTRIIFASDGSSTDTGYKNYVASMYEKGITTSSIAIGNDINKSEMESIASVGGGNYYNVINASQLKEALIKETATVQRNYLVKETITPRINAHTSVVSGITTLPSLDGYIGAALKNEATLVLRNDTDPIYAVWDYGQGTVGSFMSDLNGTWSSKYFSDDRGITLIKNIVKSLFTDTTIRSDIRVDFQQKNYTNVINVRTSSSGGANKVTATISYPDSQTKKIELILIANNTYAAPLPDFHQEGLYSIEVCKKSSNRESVSYVHTTFSYSTEYNSFYNINDSFKFVDNLCTITGGNVFTTADDIFSDDIIYENVTYNPHLPFFIIALCLFLLDIIVRKFNFKWLHEIFSKKNKNVAQ